MGGEKEKKISASSARAHTRKSNSNSSFLSPGVVKKFLIVGLVACLAWAEQAIRPPKQKLCGSPGGPPITAPRIKLRDGRHLAYKEYGLPKDKAKHKFIFIHGFDSCRNHAFIATEVSPDTIESLGLYIVGFDRPGYGESDPNPKRTAENMALDIEELADHLGLGPKFHVVGYSMGGELTWGCLKYIPHRLAGASLVAPAVNYWWSGFPSNLSTQAYNLQLPRDQWSLRVAYYAPWLTYWWQTQKLFPVSSAIAHSPDVLSRQDKELMSKFEMPENAVPVRQQGEYESLHRDMMVGFGKWDFSPVDQLANPFPDGEGTVHLWQGDEDLLVPAMLQRYIAQRLPWVKYHEIAGAGHLFPYAKGMSDAIIKTHLSVQ